MDPILFYIAGGVLVVGVAYWYLLKLIVWVRDRNRSDFTFIRSEFVECPTCRVKPGTPTLCPECLERREMFSILQHYRLLPTPRRSPTGR